MVDNTRLSEGNTPETTPTGRQVLRFSNLFVGNQSGYGVISKVPKKRAKWCSETLPVNAYRLHLEGEAHTLALVDGWPTNTSLGIVPILEDGTCWYAFIDVDDDTVDHQDLAARIKEQGLPLVVIRSTSGGAHLYLFLKEAAAARIVIDYLVRAKQALKLVRNPNGSLVEIFPKQAQLKPSQNGSWGSLPDFRTRHVVTADGPLTGYDAQLECCEAARYTLTALEGGAPIVDVVAELTAGVGPACLVEMVTKGTTPPCGRNQGLTNLGVYAMLRDDPQWSAVVEAVATKKLDEALGSRAGDPPQELEGIIRNLGRRATKYQFKCLRNYSGEKCPHASKCRTLLTQSSKLALPDLTNLVKVMTDPPRYEITVNGAKVLLGEIENLMSLHQFRPRVAAQVNIVLPLMKQPDWDFIVQDLLNQKTEEEAPDDAGELGRLRHYLYDWLEARHKSDLEQDILLSRPLTEGDRVVFRSGDFVAWLNRGRLWPKAGDLYDVLKKLGCRREKKRSVKGVKVNLWSLPLAELEDQEEAFTHPALPVKPY